MYNILIMRRKSTILLVFLSSLYRFFSSLENTKFFLFFSCLNFESLESRRKYKNMKKKYVVFVRQGISRSLAKIPTFYVSYLYLVQYFHFNIPLKGFFRIEKFYMFQLLIGIVPTLSTLLSCL